jgi:charged multivesicular body protein 3
MEEQKVRTALRQTAKQGDRQLCQKIAKELVYSKHAKERLYISKAQINSLALQLQQQLGQVRLAGGLKKSSELMRIMNRLIRIPELHHTMQNMSREMARVGLMDEMMDQTLEAMEGEEFHEEVDQEVNTIMLEVTKSVLSEVGVVSSELSTTEEGRAVTEETTQDHLTRIRERLDILKNS